MLDFALREGNGGIALSRSRNKHHFADISRRKFLVQTYQAASIAFLPSGIGCPTLCPLSFGMAAPGPSDLHIHPQYRAKAEPDDVLRNVPAGLDEFVTEKYQDQVAGILREWSAQLLESAQKTNVLERVMTPNFSGSAARGAVVQSVRAGSGLKISRMKFGEDTPLGRDAFLRDWRSTMQPFSNLLAAKFEVTSIRAGSASSSPGVMDLETSVRFELVGAGMEFHREQRAGSWRLDWEMPNSGEIRLRKWRMLEEERSRSLAPMFVDIASQVFDGNPSYVLQLVPGTDHWRAVLDGACGIDIYGHSGISFADIHGDGFDDLYVCQPAGLPNRLYRNRGDGSFEDVTAKSGLGILDNTSCALFADVDNDGRQDAIIVAASGPLLFLNSGGGKFRAQRDAFRFANAPQGSFTGAAVADYDRDGWLDVYFCLYAYYQGTGQYRYPMPYYAAENGPPNFLMHNQRDGTFRDVTRETGLDQNNTRFSFCCGWGDDNGDGWPDLYVANDFGGKNLYRNKGNGTFTDVAREAGVEDIGAGMSVCWLDYDNDGRDDLYVADMWTAAGVRISGQEIFQTSANEEIRALFRKHAMGNSLFHNRGDGHFEDVSLQAGTAMGRWSWSSDAWDFDQDGFVDVYIANGMISGVTGEDLNSFFWRQVVARSPTESKPRHDYEQGWNAINELIRADGTWSGFERNVLYLNNRDGTFSEISGAAGLDFIEDSRTFALADFDHDGRLEAVVKNRNSPQLRVVKNVMPEVGAAIVFRLSGKSSNRDAIGAAVTVASELGQQTRRLQAGSGFLAQHSKELFFGLGSAKGPVEAAIRWPNGLVQNLSGLPVNRRVWVEEGSTATHMEPFKASSAVTTSRTPAAVQEREANPDSEETWLLVPLAAPDFSLPDLAGKVETLSARRGKRTLVHFWSAASANCAKQVMDLNEFYTGGAGDGLQMLTINVNEGSAADAESALAAYRHLSLPILRASADTIAVYNLLYRYVFDRHRDLSLPASFLIDENGAVVKIYQGVVPKEHFERDSRAIPRTVSDRMAKALPFPGVSDTFEFARNHLSFGAVFFERGYLEQAQTYFELAARDDPSTAEPVYGLGSVYLQQQKGAKARESFDRALQLRANYPGTLPNCWNNLGILAAREGRIDEAIDNLQRALQIDPDHQIALDNLGNAYRQAKRWDDAETVLRRALKRNPEDADANYGLGMVFAQLNDTEHAYEHLQKALAVRPAYPEALNNLGILYVRTRRPEEAEKSFRESIRVAPEFDQSYLNLARLYALEGDNAKARAVLLELLKQHPGHAQAERELEALPQ
jgi:tetratricopeptide (TPR) repeat protein